MRIDVENKEILNGYFKKIIAYAQRKPLCFTKYIDLGVKVIRILSYDQGFLAHIQRQLTYVLRGGSL